MEILWYVEVKKCCGNFQKFYILYLIYNFLKKFQEKYIKSNSKKKRLITFHMQYAILKGKHYVFMYTKTYFIQWAQRTEYINVTLDYGWKKKSKIESENIFILTPKSKYVV